MSQNSLRQRDRVLLVFAGLLFVAMTTVIALIIEANSSNTQLFDQYIQPFTLAAAGLGTGHYIGRSMRQKDSIHLHFASGFFLGLFIESIVFTMSQSVLIGSSNLILPYPTVVITTALFAFVMHLSPAIPDDDNFTKLMNVFAGPVVTGFLVLSTIIEFYLSLAISLDTFGWVVVLACVGGFGMLLAYAHGLQNPQPSSNR